MVEISEFGIWMKHIYISVLKKKADMSHTVGPDQQASSVDHQIQDVGSWQSALPLFMMEAKWVSLAASIV